MPATYDEGEILSVIAGLGKGNPGRDVEVRELLRTILQNPDESGLSVETLEKVRQAAFSSR